MALRFRCPSCGGELQAPDATAGHRGACHFCGARLIAPANADQTATLAAPGPDDGPRAPSPPLHYASFGKRALSMLADTVVFWVLLLVLNPLFRALNPWPLPDLNALLMQLTQTYEGAAGMPPDVYGVVPDAMGLALGLGFMLTGTATLHWLYYALFESSTWQATPGKLLTALRVTDMRGNRVGFGQATMREVGRGFSSMLCFIGYLMAAFTEKHQALHDLLAQTLVLDR